jgi:hypothetical protein
VKWFCSIARKKATEDMLRVSQDGLIRDEVPEDALMRKLGAMQDALE